MDKERKSRDSSAKASVLIVEDDPMIRVGLEMNLRYEGYSVLSAASGERALKLFRESPPDLMILDLMLSDCSGYEVLKRVHLLHDSPRILIVSALHHEEDVIKGLKLGADDYVRKPFSTGELLARIEASLRRGQSREGEIESRNRDLSAQGESSLGFGEIRIDPAARRVLRARKEVPLTPREFDLLFFMYKRRGRSCSRGDLLEAIWGGDYEGTSRTIDNFIRSLRTKIEDDPAIPSYLQTVRGIGYRLDYRKESLPEKNAINARPAIDGAKSPRSDGKS